MASTSPRDRERSLLSEEHRTRGSEFQAPRIRDSFQVAGGRQSGATGRGSTAHSTAYSVADVDDDGVDDDLKVQRLTWTDRNDVSFTFKEKPLTQVCPFILLQECCERLAFYGMTTTLKPFLKKTLGVTDAQASSYIEYFMGIIYLPPIFSAIISDTFIGTYKTILYFSIAYACGLALLAVSALDGVGQKWMVFLSLYCLIAIGSGGIKSCVNVFGAQQFHPSHQQVEIKSFFTYFYASINVGSIVGILAVPQTADSVSFFAAYLIPLGAFLLATCLFIFGSSRYVKIGPQGSPVVAVAKVLFAAARKCSIQQTKISQGGVFEDRFVDDTLELLRVLPVVSMVMPMMIAYNQTTTAFLTQGEKMKSTIFGARFTPAQMFNIDAISVVCATLIVERLIFPRLRERDLMPNIMTKFAIGNVFAMCAMLSAFFVELAVKAQDEPNTLSIWWQVPQFALIAWAEIFTVSTSYEVAFTLAPVPLKTVSSALNLIFFSIAGFLSGLLFVIFEGWMPDFNENDPDTYKDAHYDYYYLVLATLCLLGLGATIAMRPYLQWLLRKKRAPGDEGHGAEGEALEDKALLDSEGDTSSSSPSSHPGNNGATEEGSSAHQQPSTAAASSDLYS